MTDALRLYGTDAPEEPAEQITLGPLQFSLQAGALRHICCHGVEVLRGIAFLVRDRDWGTLAPQITEIRRRSGPSFLLDLSLRYDHRGARLHIALTIEATETGLLVTAEGQADAPFETNRTGFTILHPAAVAGHPVTIRHADGHLAQTTFPQLIAPWQPFQAITGITQARAGVRARCDLAGDVFEMEDQRQWGDASFKTYNRPLALPWPYLLQPKAPLSQSVRLTWERCAPDPAPPDNPAAAEIRFPETALLLTPAEARQALAHPADLLEIRPQRLLCHIDQSLGDIPAQIAAFAALQSRHPDLIFDAELIALFDRPVRAVLEDLQATMQAAGFAPASLLICPSVDRQSTPPGSPWPPCPPLAEIHATAAQLFADCPRGGGMVSFFPELNRKRPPLDHLAFVSHGLCPIVHAADDLHVMETLETIPHITRSARAIIGDRAYRIGPSTIAMRHNPYGQRTIPNPTSQRLCMAEDDPRHRAAFGAAYTLGLATALAQAQIEVWTPAELCGPRGLTGPIRQVIAALARCAGAPVRHAAIAQGRAELVLGAQKFRANLTPRQNSDLGPYEWTSARLDA